MRYFLFSAIAATGLLAVPALAQPPENGEQRGDRPRREEMRERMLKEFDKDGDGKLSDEERQKAREAMRERFGRRGPDGGRGRDGGPRGKDGKGKKGDRGPDRWHGHHAPGGGPPPPPHFEMLFNRFDEDKNDVLSRDEFAKLAEFLHHHRHHRHGPPPAGPPRGPRFDDRGPDGPPPGGEEFRRRHRPEGPPGPPPRPGDPPGPPPNPDDNADEAI